MIPPVPPPEKPAFALGRTIGKALGTMIKVLTVFVAGLFALLVLPMLYQEWRAGRRINRYQEHPAELKQDLREGKRITLYDPGEETVDVNRLPKIRLEPSPAPLFERLEDVPRVDGATAFYQLTEGALHAVAPEPKDEVFRRRFSYTRTTNAYRHLVAGKTDVIFVLEPSKQQRAEAKAQGVELNLTPIGREAFVFFVRRDNPVGGLTLGQIRSIYAGKTTHWREVGGPDLPIRAFQRPPDSGSQTAMLAAVMGDVPIDLPPVQLSRAMSHILARVLSYDNAADAIGYSFRYYATAMMQSPNIKLLAIDGVEPTPATIADGSYPLTRDFYAVTTQRSAPGAAKLVEWLRSETGAELIRRAGYTAVRSGW